MGGKGIAVGGGAAGLVVMLIIALLGGNPLSGSGGPDQLPLGTGNGGQEKASTLSADCKTGSDANQRSDCRIVAVVNSVQEYWKGEINGYKEAPTTFFTGQVSTGCGAASTEVGPFYCPADSSVYIDLSFYKELQTRFGAKGGPFAEAYVIAHEYGHHVQNLLGISAEVNRTRSHKSRTQANSLSVSVELQADCFAGVWTHHSQKSKGWLEQGDIEEALNAAAQIGDDTLQRKTEGVVVPESFTHGTSEQRVRWFTHGLQTGNIAQCNTLEATQL